MKPVALFGGTFDPVHNGHAAIIGGAFEQLGIERLVVLPAGNPYQRGRPPMASAAARMAMLHLAFAAPNAASPQRISIDKRELNRIGPTYTVHTLLELRRELGDTVPLIWLIGADAFNRLDTWYRWQELFELCHFAVARRAGGMTGHTSPELAAFLRPRRGSVVELSRSPAGHCAELELNPPGISSTEIRRRCVHGESLRGLVSDAVCDYIERHKLYLTEEK
ncbi:MAG TPA: nicotinate-nucleotide adenylyltransferase [Usitatibacteraceae bacterium]